MKTMFGAIVILIAATAAADAQQKQAAAVREAMDRLSFLAGSWKGTGSIQFGPNRRETAQISETGTLKLNKSVFLIEGRGTATAGGREIVVHSALGIISYDAAAKKYRMRTYRAGGEQLDPDIEVSDGKIVWSFESPRGGTIRFTLTVKDGVWTEIGEASRDKGKTWYRFFEMKLKKVKSKS